ncbi:MAG: ATP-binding protein [Deltaproteobacteria bacterium]|jgi:hypothetical protein|nr:ATP-binding protein [Deltaproteobacteria bacterium]
MERLPIGIQSFRAIIEDGDLYADKTRFIYDLASKKGAYFLSRPRRFGKSLLLATFKELFSGPTGQDGDPRGLFEGLWIGSSDFDFTRKFPVVSLSMSGGTESLDVLKDSLMEQLNFLNLTENLNLSLTLPTSALHMVIKNLSLKHKTRVVVLIDEYDAPVSSNLADPKLAVAFSNFLKSFYASLKDLDDYLRFVFVTGVTRYAFMGLSAGLNQLADLTFDDRFSEICGFTTQELDRYFGKRMPSVLSLLKKEGSLPKNAGRAVLRQLLMDWYGGYSWDGKTKLLNPWSVLRFFYKPGFYDYWGEMDNSSSFLSSLPDNGDKDPLVLAKDSFELIPQRAIRSADIGKLKTVPALFQTGYLTVDKVKKIMYQGVFYTLKKPNLEVRIHSLDLFSESMFAILKKTPQAERDFFSMAVRDKDAERLTDVFGSLFAGLDPSHHQPTESFYNALVYAYCSKLGRLALSEPRGSKGTPDLALLFQTPSSCVCAVIELKFDRGETAKDKRKLVFRLADDALKAIETKDYWRPYKAQADLLVKIGIGVTYRGECLVKTAE